MSASTSSDAGGSAVQDYNRVNFYYPAIEAVIQDMKNRFGWHQQWAAQFCRVLPALLCSSNLEEHWKDLSKAIILYQKFFSDSLETIKLEYQLWVRKWESQPLGERPKSAVEALEFCGEFFPNMATLLEIMACLPVSTAQPERVFSKLERTLTAIRSTMTEFRLESFLLLETHREYTPSLDSVIDRFALTSARRLNFILWGDCSVKL